MNQVESRPAVVTGKPTLSPRQIQSARDDRRIRRLGIFLRPFARLAYRRRRIPVIAITGSVGKSTTTAFIARVLGTTFRVVRTPGNYTDLTGVPTTILGVGRIKTVRRYLREFPRVVFRTFVRQHRADYFVLEVAAGGIEHQLTIFSPRLTVVTAITDAHVEMFGSVEGIIREKGRLVRALPETGHAVLCYDDAFNANPASMRAALETFREVAGERRRVVVLGDMYELVEETARFHREVGQQAAAVADVLIGVGEHAHDYVREFTTMRPSVPAFHRRNVEEAFEVVRRELRPGDAVLLKASHGVELQKLIPRIRSLDLLRGSRT